MLAVCAHGCAPRLLRVFQPSRNISVIAHEVKRSNCLLTRICQRVHRLIKKVRCGCDACQRSRKQAVSRSTYNDTRSIAMMSVQFNHFINMQTRISESHDDIPMPVNSEDGIDDMVRHFEFFPLLALQFTSCSTLGLV